MQHLLKNELDQKYKNFTIQEDRIGILSGRKELDIYCPELNLGIEYNGLNWHAEKYNNFTQFRHYDKWKECFNLNVKFLAVWSDEFEKYNKRIKTMIDSFFTLNNTYKDINYNNIQIKESIKQKTRVFAIDNFYKCFSINYENNEIAYFYINTNNELIDFWFVNIELNNIQLFNFIIKKLHIDKCIFENRFLSYYIQFIEKFKYIDIVNPRFYIFDTHRSFSTKNEFESCNTDRIWNYGYQILEIN